MKILEIKETDLEFVNKM